MVFRKIQATNLNSVETSFTDSIMVLNKAGTPGQDVGWLGKTSGSTYSGIIKDGDDGNFYLINNVTLGSQQVNDVNPANITTGTLVANIETQNVTVTNNFLLPKGTTAQRPASPVEGQMWFNTTTKMFEGYDGTNWVQLVPSTFTETP